MTHYISDVGVFGHTMGNQTDWSEEIHHSDYEDAVDGKITEWGAPASFTLGNLSAYDAALGLARNVTFGKGAIKSNVWMDDNYNWSDSTFMASARATLNETVSDVAAAINHLLVEAGQNPQQPRDDIAIVVIGGSICGISIAIVITRRRNRRLDE